MRPALADERAIIKRPLGRPPIQAVPIQRTLPSPAVATSTVTIVNSADTAAHALAILCSPELRVRHHAIDTEVCQLDLNTESVYGHGRITAITIYCGSDVNFGNGARLFIDTLDTVDGADMFAIFKDYLTDKTIRKVFHNFSFDAAMFYNHNINIGGFAADTMHMARLCDSARASYSLESLSADYCNRTKISMKTLFSLPVKRKDGSDGKLRSIPPIETLQRSTETRLRWIDYATYDAQSTYELRLALQKRLQSIPWDNEAHTHLFDWYEQWYVPFAQILVEMERAGMYIRAETYLPELERLCHRDKERERQVFIDWATTQWPEAKYMNVASSVQKKHFLFGERGSIEHFDRPNVEGVIEEGKKRAKKNTTFALSALGLPCDVRTKKDSAAVTLTVIRKLAGRPRADPPVLGRAADAFADIADADERYQKQLAACDAFFALSQVSAMSTMLATFIRPLQTNLDANSRVHCQLNINTETGRLSSRGPNLQNQPALDKDIYKIRQAFSAAPGKQLIVADYGQLELRLLAHMTNCQSMIKAFALGGDFHSRTAMAMYDHVKTAVDNGTVLLEAISGSHYTTPLLKDVFSSERKKAKILNFSIAYGKTAHGLSKDWNVSVQEAEATVRRWYSDRPEVLDWQQRTIQEAKRSGVTRTLMGRYRRLVSAPGRGAGSIVSGTRSHTKHWERAAINTPIQGGAADTVMAAMIKLHKHERLRQLQWKQIMQIHDEIILEGPQEHSHEALAIVKECMSAPFAAPLLVDLVVDAKIGNDWYSAK